MSISMNIAKVPHVLGFEKTSSSIQERKQDLEIIFRNYVYFIDE